MVDTQKFIVTKDVALRTGVNLGYKYRTKDGRFILDARTLSNIRFTSDEIMNGLSGIEKITDEEAKTLIAQNNYNMGMGNESEESEVEEPKEEETIESDEVGNLEDIIKEDEEE